MAGDSYNVRAISKINRLVIKLLCAVGLELAAGSLVYAQHYIFREYVQGLGNLNIVCMVQDRTGYLWVGTQNGLFRYDGSQFQSFGAAQGVPGQIIQNLYLSPDGTLWVTTTKGIYFELPNGQFAEVKPPAGENQLQPLGGTAFAADSAEELVTLTRSGAIRLKRTAPAQWYAERLPLEGGTIRSAAYAPDGSLWYGCDTDLCRLKNGKSEHVSAMLGLPEGPWNSMLVTREGHLWLRSPRHVGEIDLATSQFTLRDLTSQSGPGPYSILAQDAQGRVITSQGTMLAMWQNGAWRWVTKHNGLAAYVILCVYVDREGSVWIGQVGHGLKRWAGQDRWEGFTKADGLSDDLIWSILRDRKGRLWLGTEGGIDYIPAGQQLPRHWRQANAQTSPVSALATDARGAVWAASLAGQLLRIDPDTLEARRWTVPGVTNIATDREGHVWVATTKGLYVVDADAGAQDSPVRVQEAAFRNAKQRFLDLRVDARGWLWAAADQGLLVRDGSGWHAIDMGSTAATPDTIAVDKNGAIWAAGPLQDLVRLRIEGYRVVDAKRIGRPPLLSQIVVSLMVDSRNWLWVGQDAGLAVFDGDAWHSYTQEDGLLWNDTDSYALAEDKDGSIWVGTSCGLSHLLTPQNLTVSTPAPPAFSQVKYGNTLLSNGASVSSSSDMLEISMALLSFQGTQINGIRYRLVGGGSSEWEKSREMQVHYHYLPPGNYRFEVAEIDQAGHVVSPVGSFAFRITPRWWQRTSLRVGFGLLVLVAIILIWRKRVGILIRQKMHLEEAVQQRTTDLLREKGELLRTKEQMRHFAERDDLTGLWNHRIIVDRLRIEVDRSRREDQPLSVILVDLDHFKRINDTLGHPAGDLVLKETSAIFQKRVRTYDWVGRYGGEEFLIVLPGSSSIDAQQRAEELREALEMAQLKYGETRIPVTASFGVACGLGSHEELIRQADAALYRAKNNGRNCVMAAEVRVRKTPQQVAQLN